MTNLLAALLTLAVVVYGFLLIVGGPRLANELPLALGRMSVRAARELLHAIMRSLLSILAGAIQFVFWRPRR